ncbi:hypothetical protein KJ840_03925 [Patescibacteria group bacterium]|nr:hypothetical protein [Patescibacteria group bacterium]
MNEYYQNFVTEKSFIMLKKFKDSCRFILIGGWAVFFYTHSLKSKDIDIIIDFEELSKLKENYEVFKNDRLKKYEISIEEVDIDIYLPRYSEFCLPIEDIQKTSRLLEGFKVPTLEILLILKQQAYLARRGSVKGEKDKLDILSLLALDKLNFDLYKKLIADNKLSVFRNDLLSLVKDTKEIEQLNLNVYKFSKLRKKFIDQLS